MTEQQHKIRIFDPHIHLCDMESGIYPHFRDRGPDSPFARTYTLADFLAEAEGAPEIVGAVHVEAFPTDPEVETRTTQRIADDCPFPLLLVGHADLLSDGFEALIERHASYPVFRGIRQVVNVHRDPAWTQAKTDLLNAPGFTDGLRHLGRHGFSFDMQLLGHQLARAAEVAAECPDTLIIVNHAALWTDRTPEGWRIYKDGLRLMAERPNVAIKISGLGMRDATWSNGSIQPIVYEVLEAFGTGRAMFASNFPVDRMWSDYPRIWRAFDELTASMSATERDALFFCNAQKFYRAPGG